VNFLSRAAPPPCRPLLFCCGLALWLAATPPSPAWPFAPSPKRFHQQLAARTVVLPTISLLSARSCHHPSASFSPLQPLSLSHSRTKPTTRPPKPSRTASQPADLKRHSPRNFPRSIPTASLQSTPRRIIAAENRRNGQPGSPLRPLHPQRPVWRCRPAAGWKCQNTGPSSCKLTDVSCDGFLPAHRKRAMPPAARRSRRRSTQRPPIPVTTAASLPRFPNTKTTTAHHRQ
jgi:hypothetical protein